jgi:hypothetical protein
LEEQSDAQPEAQQTLPPQEEAEAQPLWVGEQLKVGELDEEGAW